MRKNFVALLCFLAVLMAVWSLCSAETLVVATSEWPPYGDVKDGKAVGFATEIIEKVAPKAGLNVKIEFMPWKRATEMAKNGEVDAIYSASFNNERAEFLIYPKTPLHPSEYVFFIRKADSGKLKFESFDDLKAYKIGVTRGYAYSDELNKKMEEFKNSEEANTDELNFEKLNQGRIEYFPADLLNGTTLLKKLGFQENITHIDKRIKVKDYFIAFSKKSPKITPELVSKFSDELNAFTQTEEYKKIKDQYYKQ